MKYWQYAKKNEIRFGNTDLVLKGGLQTVTSKIGPPNSSSNPKEALISSDINGGRNGKSAGAESRDGVNSYAETGSHFYFGSDVV